MVAVVGRPQPARPAAELPGLAFAREQVHQAELIDADHPTVGGRVVIQVEDAAHLGDESSRNAAYDRVENAKIPHGMVRDE